MKGSFAGTNFILEIGFEEDGKELSGMVSKKVAGLPDVSMRFKGDLSKTRVKMTFPLSAAGGALVVGFASLDLSTDVALDAYDHAIPEQIMNKVKLRDQFLASAKPRIEAAIRSSRLPGAIQEAFRSILGKFGIQTVTAVRAAAHGGADVVGR